MQRMYRMTSRPAIEHVIRQGRRRDSLLFLAMVRKNSCGHLRLVLVASKAVDKSAVVRNRIRRRAGQWVGRHPDILALPYDAALIFKKSAAEATRHVFYEELSAAFSDLGALS